MWQRALFLLRFVVVTTGILISANIWGEEPPVAVPPSLPPIATDPPTLPGKTSTEEFVRQTLAKPIELKFDETPLDKAVAILQEKLHINIILDKRALEAASITIDTPVTLSISNLPANDALALMLRDLDLTIVIQNKVLYITTQEEADSRLETRIYDVADLVHYTESKIEQADFDTIIEAITTTLRPTTWDSVGGPGSIAPFKAIGIEVLIICQTHEVHEEIANLLANLRAIRRGGNKIESDGTTPAIAVPQPAGAAVKTSPFTPQEEKIRQTLSLPLALQFEETPLKKIAEYIHNNTNLQVAFDRNKLAESNVDIEKPMTVDFVGLEMSNAFDSMFKETGIGWTIYKGTLLITTPDEIDCLLETRTYDVSDLPAYRNRQGEPEPDYENLIDTITSTIEPTTWDAVGGPGTIVIFEGKGIQAIVVNHKWAVHQKVDKLLNDLRKMRKTALTKEDIEKLPLSPSYPPSTEKPFESESTKSGSGMF